MRVTPSSSDRSAKPPLPIETRRPFIPTPSDTTSAPTEGAPSSSVQRTAATPPATPSQSGAPAASTPGGAKTPPPASGNLETDLLRWMGLPDDTPVAGTLARKPSDNVADMMRKAEASTARPSEPTQSAAQASESASESAATNTVSSSGSFEPLPSISTNFSSRDMEDVQRAVIVDEVSSEVNESGPGNQGGNTEEAIDNIAHRVLDMIRARLRLERERNRKF
jgi:hypothetical protein